MKKQLSHYIIGRTVRVFTDPLTRLDEEETGTVKEILRTPEQTGVEGQYYVEVTFPGDRNHYRRFVNVGDVFGV